MSCRAPCLNTGIMIDTLHFGRSGVRPEELDDVPREWFHFTHVSDPKSYTAPWTVTLRQPLVLDSELLDYYCLENEKSWVHMK